MARTALTAMLAVAAPASGQQQPPQWHMASPTTIGVVGSTTDRRLAEASGLARSVANPGLFWTIGDSGNPPELLAVDTSGALRAVIPIAGVTNIDWEAVAVGPCGNTTCVYIADVGDNAERRSGVAIHRLPEPVLPTGAAVVTTAAASAQTLRLRYPDHPHDVEAAGVTPAGDLMLVTKGRSNGILVFEVPANAWNARIPAAVATARGPLPIVANLGRGEAVTGLAINPEGTRVAIRTYRSIYLFERGPDGNLHPDHWTACGILGLEPQGEGITWLDANRLLLISEKALFAAGTVSVVECTPRTDE